MLAHWLWRWMNAGAAGRFRRALADPARVQAGILTGYMRGNAGTAYGKLHRFEQVRSAVEYQQRVPVTTYDDYTPFIQRIAAGEENVLTAERVMYFAPTSGSTSAEKYIPYTRSLLREFNAAIGPWINDLFANVPGATGGPAYWSITPAISHRGRIASKVPIGFDEDAAYLNPVSRWLAESTLAVPSAVARIGDVEEFQFRTLRHLLATRELRLISVWHPSFLMLLLGAVPRHWERLLREIGAERARELEGLGPGDASRFWPRLALISCWTHGHAELSARELQACFPQTPVQPKGLISTEAFASLPWHGRDVHATVHPLAMTSHFFEFMADDGRVILPEDVDVNGEYTLIISTAGGLYRYNTSDRVRVTGRLFQTPCIRFLGKQDHVSDLRGEKLGAVFVGEVLRRLVREASFAMLAPNVAGTPHYTLFVESAAVPAGLSQTLDQALSANPHYAYCRHLGQLGPVTIVRVRDGGAAYLEACRQDGQRLGTIKPTPLHAGHNWPAVFKPHALPD